MVQFPIEHLAPPRDVGLPREGTTPPLGQSVWRRRGEECPFPLRSAWGIESPTPAREASAAAWQIGYIQQWLLTALIIGLFVMIGGTWGLVLFVAQAAFGVFTTEYVNYAQHYGLSRESRDPPRGSLSWNSNSFMTNAFTLNITRHVHHHLDAGVPYYDLKPHRIDALLPGGYLTLFFPAMIPPVWRRLMDARRGNSQLP